MAANPYSMEQPPWYGHHRPNPDLATQPLQRDPAAHGAGAPNGKAQNMERALRSNAPWAADLPSPPERPDRDRHHERSWRHERDGKRTLEQLSGVSPALLSRHANSDLRQRERGREQMRADVARLTHPGPRDGRRVPPPWRTPLLEFSSWGQAGRSSVGELAGRGQPPA